MMERRAGRFLITIRRHLIDIPHDLDGSSLGAQLALVNALRRFDERSWLLERKIGLR